MSSKVCLLLFLFYISTICCYSLSVYKSGKIPTSCPRNEEPTDCVEYCLPTCDRPKRSPCIYGSCYAGCVCKEGYIRKSEKQECVKIESCVDPDEISRNYTVPCKENELATTCVVAECEATCAYPNPPACSLLWCEAGCVCKEGFIRSHLRGNCVLRSSC